jgi:hypothetical protein
MSAWRIWYTDGSSFSSEDGEPSAAPCLAVICIAQPSYNPAAERELVHEFDWYWWRPDEQQWYGGDVHGFLDQAMRLGAVWPKQGCSLRTDKYQAILSAAVRRPLP